MFEFKMPQLGETVLEATITRWLKNVGDTVQEDDPLVEVSTDKVDSEIPSPYSGVISKILFKEGEVVPVGAVMVQINSDVQDSGPQSGQAAPASSPTSDASAAPAKSTAQQTAVSGEAPGKSTPPAAGLSGVLSPLVRRLAAENGVDLSTVAGTGSGGRITKQDVLEASKRVAAPSPESLPDVAPDPMPAAAPPSPPEPQRAAAPVPPLDSRPTPEPLPLAALREAGGSDEIVQVSQMRRSIAEHMVASSTQTARAWNAIEVDLSKVGHLRGLAGPGFKEHEGFSLTWMPFVSMAVTSALLKFPQLNSTWNGDGTITRKHYVNLGIAVALENGLIVPVIKHTEGMNLVGLARAVRDIADRARTKKLTPDDVQGGTFTITNPGGFGSIMSVPIINKGQTAILSFDAVIKRPVVVTDPQGGESIGIRQMTYLSMSWDHRIIDGAEAARFLAYLKALLEEADFTADLSGLLST